MEVRLPNGVVMQGVPDGTSKEAIMQKAIGAGLATQADFTMPAGATQTPPRQAAGSPAARPAYDPEAERQRILRGMAENLNWWDALRIGMGKGFYDVGRGIGLVEEAGETEKLAYQQVEEVHPYAAGGGEIVGEAAPFLIPGTAIGRFASMGSKIAGAGALGALEGGILASAEDKDAAVGAGIGGTIGAAAEAVFPVVGRLGRKVFERVMGRPPAGAIFDAAGNPTEEMQEALNKSGLTMDDLTEQATDVIEASAEAVEPEEVAKAALFAEEGVPMSRSESMGPGREKFKYEATEQRLLQSALDPQAEPFRQFKLQQSEKIKESLGKSIDFEAMPEETGTSIIDALSNRKNLLRTEKNDLYRQAEEAAKNVGGIPVFTDGMSATLPDANKWDDLAITAEGPMNSLDKLLTKYGVKEAPEEMIKKGFEPTPLTMSNVESFRKSLNAIERADQTGASTVAIAPVRNALDGELDELSGVLEKQGYGSDVVGPLKKARRTTAQMKKEFNPKSLVGRLTETKKGSDIPLIEGSKVYNSMMSKAASVEDVRRVSSSLAKSAEGKKALSNLQMTTMLDLVNAGFGTKSRTIDGTRIFNPIAFRNRIEAIGKDKLAAIFRTNKTGLARIKNIERIAEVVTPSAAATPKGSQPGLWDIMDRLGMAAITANLPGVGPAIEGFRRLSEGGRQRVDVAKAMTPEMKKISHVIDDRFSNIGAAMGIAGALTSIETEDQKLQGN